MANYQTRTGSVVNPLDGLREGFTAAGNIYQNYITQQDREKALQLDRENQERRLALAEEKTSWQRDELDRANQQREFLQNYNPEIGRAESGQGWKGISKDVLGEVSGQTGTRLEDINKAYDLGGGRTLEDLRTESPEQFDAYNRDISRIAGQARSMQDAASRPEYMAVSKENVQRETFDDILRATGNATLAQKQSEALSAPYYDRDQIKENEQAQTDALVERMKNAKDIAKFNIKRSDKYKKMAADLAKKDPDNLTSMDVTKFIEEADIGGGDSGRVQEAVDLAIQKEGHNPKDVIRALKNSFDPDYGLFWNDRGFRGTSELFGSDPRNLLPLVEQAKKERLEGSSRGSIGDDIKAIADRSIAEEQRILNMPLPTNRSISEIRRDTGRSIANQYLGERPTDIQREFVQERPTDIQREPVQKRPAPQTSLQPAGRVRSVLGGGSNQETSQVGDAELLPIGPNQEGSYVSPELIRYYNNEIPFIKLSTEGKRAVGNIKYGNAVGEEQDRAREFFSNMTSPYRDAYMEYIGEPFSDMVNRDVDYGHLRNWLMGVGPEGVNVRDR